MRLKTILNWKMKNLKNGSWIIITIISKLIDPVGKVGF